MRAAECKAEIAVQILTMLFVRKLTTRHPIGSLLSGARAFQKELIAKNYIVPGIQNVAGKGYIRRRNDITHATILGAIAPIALNDTEDLLGP